MSDFVDFYQQSYRGLPAQLSAYLGDPSNIGDYDDPAPWVRRVAWNLATSRWRLAAATRVFAAAGVRPNRSTR